MKTPQIKTSKPVVPMIYAYTTPGISYHDGYIKIGYTEQEVDERIRQQTHTAGVKAKKEWQGNALFMDGSGESFLDHDLHAYMRKKGVKQPMDLGNEYFDENDRNEWFYTSPDASKKMYLDFCMNRGVDGEDDYEILPYKLRSEQDEAVGKTADYRAANESGEFLWNAKPRFGKTLSVYDFAKRIKAEKVLVVTNRPAVANSWYQDYYDFIGRQSGYFFVSHIDEIKDKPSVIDWKQYEQDRKSRESRVTGGAAQKMGVIYFLSLQDLKGSVYFGGTHQKLKEITDNVWDVLVIDEAHEGIDTFKTDVAFDRINRKFTLHLSGTPFKALANNKFADNAIFNWTYADEQKKKRDWNDADGENPYANLPKLNLYTYQMSEIIKDELSHGVEINGETEEYAFDLNEFFATDGTGKFRYSSSVDKFLDALTTQKKFPFSTPELRDELKHTFWMLNRVDSAKALAKKLKDHPVFCEYEIVLAAGDGRLDDEDEIKKAFEKVRKAIDTYEKTITISVGQLSTGVTIPEWTAVLMLSNMKSPALYMQAAFRAQNPCLFQEGAECRRKENAYVFDFDPARTLTIFEEFANDLCSETSAGKGTLEEREKNIRELLNFFPVIGEDENGELIELDPEKVLTIPRKIRSVEVVKRGFMSNFLFQNIGQIFGAPKEVLDIIQSFQPIEEPKSKVNLPEEVKKGLNIDENGEVSVPDDIVIGLANDIFGDKIYDIQSAVDSAISNVSDNLGTTAAETSSLRELVKKKTVDEIVTAVAETYGDDLKISDKKRLEAQLSYETDKMVEKAHGNYKIDIKVAETERAEAMQSRFETGKSTEEIEAEFEDKKQKAAEKFKAELSEEIDSFIEKAGTEAVKQTETKKKEREKETIEDGVRDHLRGFSRTIPSFLMAYGENEVTLATFDTTVPDKVFTEVTSITLEQFRFLRDGGDYTDEETGETKHFEGNLFDPIVFDDSVKEFLRLKKKLADYFDEKSIEDIFDYIPPQKTNQIFTPKNVVKKMVDMLEQENPGCFDLPDKTFIDLYMKSGLYIAEIVKRLYRSEKLKELYPNDKERLKHIFEKQVYGLAPTEIIYKIAISYILGFDEEMGEISHNFKLLDALPYAKEGILKEKLDEIFGGE